MADIQKAFLQVAIHPEDQKYLRFVWKHDQIIRKFQFKVLPFGLICSPAILTIIIADIIDHLPKKERKIAKGTVYMDDVMLGGRDKNQLIETIKQLSKEFKQSGFDLHKIKSNSKEINKKLN